MSQSVPVSILEPFGSGDGLAAYRQPISMTGDDLADGLSLKSNVAGASSRSAAAKDEHSVVTGSFDIVEDHF